MRVEPKEPPRVFSVGTQADIRIRDSGDIHLDADEQVSFVVESGRRYDVVRKEWGFYATPSINGRLAGEGFRTALVQNAQGLVYVVVVEFDKQDLFERHCQKEGQTVVEWLDDIRLAPR
jgi:hypothetical protein